MNLKTLKIYVVSRPNVDIKSAREFLKDNSMSWKTDASAEPAELLTEIAGRVCYMSFNEDTKRIRYPTDKYIANLIAKGHESVLEHVSWTFIIDGVSRAFTHQLVRHRVGFAFSQLSQQYHDESEAAFVAPFGLQKDKNLAAIWEKTTQSIQNTYRTLLSEFAKRNSDIGSEHRRWQKTLARSVLPNAISTTIVVTANARAIRHFLSVRGSLEGDYEMRMVCGNLLKIVKQDAPALFSDFSLETHADGEQIVQQHSMD